MSIWFKWEQVCCFANVSILMNICHSHRSLWIYWQWTPRVIFIVDHCRIIKCMCILNVITSFVYGKVKRIDSWSRNSFFKQITVSHVQLLHKYWIVSSCINLNWISSIASYRLWWKVLHVDSELKFRDVVWKSEMFTTESEVLVVQRNK